MRSKLFVPCSRPELFAKALASQASAISFDLEDSVPETGKPAARSALVEVLRSEPVRTATKTIIVRINGPRTSHFESDVAALSGCRLDLVNIPKAEAATEVRDAVLALDRAGVTAPVLANIESARGLMNAGEIAAVHPRIVGLQVGLNDLFASLGIDRRDPRHVHAALWSVRIAAGNAGCFAYDGAWPDLADEDGFRKEAELAHGLGYLGKSCIHPTQVPLANTIFDAGDALTRAKRLLAAADVAERSGLGAFSFEGCMIDRPAIERARALLAERRA